MAATDVPPNTTPDIPRELERATRRRRNLGVSRPVDHGVRPWALCLSGGGIRSATFCLGVLQGLARSPSSFPPEGEASTGDQTPTGSRSMLAQFDYLSTVSGGGYIGSFFSALFVKGRLSGASIHGGEAAVDAANQGAAELAYRALLDDPPERMHTHTVYDPQRPGKAALAWLRDNGRYLAPTGSGDLAYASAIAIRNWLATHVVVATMSLLLLSLGLFLRLAAVAAFPDFQPLETRCQQCDLLRWSSSWYVVAAVLLAFSVPLGISFWFTHPRDNEQVSSPPHAFTTASVTALSLALAWLVGGLWGAGVWHDTRTAVPAWAQALIVAGALTLLGVAYFMASVRIFERPSSITAHRVKLTQLLTTSLMVAMALAGLAVAESLALTLANWLDEGHLLPAGSVVAGIVWVTRLVAQRMDASSPTGTKKQKLPLSLMAGLLGVVLWLTVITLMGVLLLWILSGGHADGPGLFSHDAGVHGLCLAGWLTLGLAVFAVISGRFPGFLNLSTLQGLYSARLTRAYLGASNHARFTQPSGRQHSVAEPVDGDNLSVDTLYDNPLAPMHFINVCVNQTAGPGGQLVQRDRKGKPLAIAPAGFYLDGKPYAFRAKATESSGELDSALTVGEWVGVSGAAFTTGLGRATSLGTSLLLGFANVRLGRWWASGVKDAAPLPFGLGRHLFRTQTYLLDEIRAIFHGTRLPYQYLSDGGHFENTAAYEMLRPQREVALLVVCDCGADPDYGFDDLANLIRLARIDHRVEIKVNVKVTTHEHLGRCFGTPESFTRRPDGTLPPRDGRCAMLLDVFEQDAPAATTDGATARLSARIVLLKPALVAGLPADVVNYQLQHPSFPQESTGDQFFDEAQWESYRKLGVEITRRVFPQPGGDPGYANAFRQHVLER